MASDLLVNASLIKGTGAATATATLGAAALTIVATTTGATTTNVYGIVCYGP